MPIFDRLLGETGKPVGENEVSLEEFKAWLMKKYDTNRDGRISKEELRAAIQENGGWWDRLFPSWKTRDGMKRADKNGNGLIDDNEIGHLVKFAEKHLGRRIVVV